MESKIGKPRRTQPTHQTTKTLSESPLPFVVFVNHDRVNAETRKLIRSHVMRGKRWKKKKKVDNERASEPTASKGASQDVPFAPNQVQALYTPLVPHRVGSDLSFLAVAEGVESQMLLNAFKVAPIVMRIMYPLIMSIGFNVDERQWLRQVANDVAALHITAFAIEAFIDKVLRQDKATTNPAAMLHMKKGLELLGKRLIHQDESASISNMTIGTILKLAGASHFHGYHDETKHHLEGIQKMVELRGGLQVFNGTFLQTEMLRIDLAHAVLNCMPPIFGPSQQPSLDFPDELLPKVDATVAHPSPGPWFDLLDSRLRTVWLIMGKFCMLVNLGSQTHRFINPNVIHQTMAAVMYRLLEMQFHADSLDEVIRLGLTAFSYHVFVQWQDIKPPHAEFAGRYRDCLMCLDTTNKVEILGSNTMLWFLMVGAVSLLDVSKDHALGPIWRDSIEKCRMRRWEELQDTLKTIMWVPLLDAGRRAQIYLEA